MEHILEYNAFERPQIDFHNACIDGNIQAVKHLLQNSYVNPRRERNLGLQHAIANSRSEIVKILLADERTDPLDTYHNFFHEACFLGDYESVKALLDTGLYDPSDTSNYALKVANANDNLEVIKILLEDDRVLFKLYVIEFDTMKDFLKSELMSKFDSETEEELKAVINLIR